MRVQLNLNLEGELAADIGILLEYGFSFERNIEQYLHELAEELRKQNKKSKKS